MTADQVIAAARSWIGTPYHHQASAKGVGCDCLGLLRGVYAELYGRTPQRPPPYSRDLAEATGTETLLEAARRHLIERAPGEHYSPGDAVIFRLRPGAMAKHCAIVSAAPNALPSSRSAWRMIHAFESGPVCEVPLSPWWHRRVAAAFSWPPLD
jgi:NlpC/P60 family putative phage cell wall peptidase